MPKSQLQLPQEIWDQILQYTQLSDLLPCLSVCRMWHILAKRRFYNHIEFFKFSTIRSFITCMDHGHSNLLVQTITFTPNYFHFGETLSAFKEQFQQLMTLCPQVRTLACSGAFARSVIYALHSLPIHLKNLSVFPCSPIPEYTICARRYRRTLKEYSIFNPYYDTKRTNFGKLMKFRCLRKLNIEDTAVSTFGQVEGILGMCPHLEDVSVALCDNGASVDLFDEFKRTIPQTQCFPKIKRLSFRTIRTGLDLDLFIKFLHKFRNLKQFELEAININTIEGDRELKVLKSLLDHTDTLPSTSFTIQHADSKEDIETALSYMELFLQSPALWKHTSLKIGGPRYKPSSLHYTASKSNHRELTMILPGFETYNQRTHNAYVSTFAPSVNKLKVSYHLTNAEKKSCESFLYAVLTQSTVLHSLTVAYGNCSNSLLKIASNITLHTLALDHCWLSSEFLQSLSDTCINLCQLSLTDNKFSNMKRIAMPQTNLQQLDLDMKQFSNDDLGRQKEMLITISHRKHNWYFHTGDVNRRYTKKPRKKQIQEGNQVELQFKKIERLKLFCMNRYR